MPEPQAGAGASAFRPRRLNRKDEAPGLRGCSDCRNVILVTAGRDRRTRTKEHTMNAPDMIKGNAYTVAVRGRKGVADAETVTGTFISVNTKGVNLNVDGKVRSFAVTRIASITAPANAAGDLPTGSPADVAPYFGMTAKELRVILRALGMGVGKGRRHVLDTTDVRKVADHLANA